MRRTVAFLRNTSRFIDVPYLLPFLVLLLVLYYGNRLFIALIDPKGNVYSSFLHDHLNYIDWLRNSMLYATNAFAHTIGISSYLSPPYTINTTNGAYVIMVYACLGIGLFSFWLAFVLANQAPAFKKLMWCLGGVISIWFINCCRITILLLSYHFKWKINLPYDHHTIFNWFAYSLIAILIFYFVKHDETSQIKNTGTAGSILQQSSVVE